jgi:CubicO group peptidase (beta-lactamase class C family)
MKKAAIKLKRGVFPNLGVALLSGLILVTCSLPQVRSDAPSGKVLVYPGASWSGHPDPRAVGFDPRRLKQVEDTLRTLKTTGMMVVVGGRVLFQYGDVERPVNLASVRKSLLAMLYGKYVEDGRIRLDATLMEMDLDDKDGLLPLERQAKVEHLITARSGVFHPASNTGDDTASAPARGTKEPGSYFLYNNWDFNAAGAVFERMTKRDVYEALERDLAEPIGMQDFDRKLQKKSGDMALSDFAAYSMVLSTRDLARLGLLMLREGAWEGRQVIPKRWARRIVSCVTPPGKMNPSFRKNGPWGYGCMWWVGNETQLPKPMKGLYSGIGINGQFITVLPALDMVITHLTDTSGGGSVTSSEYFNLVQAIVAARIKQGAA